MTSLLAVPRVLSVVIVMLLMLCAGSIGASAASAAEISGVAFKDLNRDGVKQATEEALVGKEIYAFSDAGTQAHAPTDASGRYVISGLEPARYSVFYGTVEWWELWRDWAPSTTGSERPHVTVDVTDRAAVDFGWRPIVRSTDRNAPISSYVTADGLRINSYNDVVDARKIHDALALTSLRGGERPFTTIHFDYLPSTYCETSAIKSNGVWGSYRALCYIGYLKWLDQGDVSLVHEYGHAWSMYHAYVVQQDPTLAGYLRARGLDGDPRVGSTEEWSPGELIAEDYRQLFGSPNAAAWPQDNTVLAPARDVAGLREFLAGPFMLPPSSPPPTTSPTMHVAALAASASKGSRRWSAAVTVTIEDASGQPVGGADVAWAWSADKGGGSGQLACTTQAAGTCSATVDLATKVDSATFRVMSIAKNGVEYDSAGNTAPTTVTVARPR